MTPQLDYKTFWIIFLLTLTVLCAIIALISVLSRYLSIHKDFEKERQTYIDRIMARSLTEYSVIQDLKKEDANIAPEEPYNKWEDDNLAGTVQDTMPEPEHW